MGTIELDRRKHFVRETWVSRFFQQRHNEPNIITFWNTETNQWVLGTWLNKDRGLVAEIDDLGANFETMTAEFVQSIGRCYKREVLAKERERLIRDWKRQKAWQEESLANYTDRYNHLKKRNRGRTEAPLLFKG